ncbi:N-terminal domain of Peptidase_S41 [Myxococcus fulvus]|uniref:Interphotoreceptor retinoid-binding protein n=1 Tax=Myxococcus fulvus TaxID=33 RepID=A0A511T643_MYXFU|nr:S41 family peptidase [Myxococcus fulvus]GEN09636.1 interphotoreceptor retinoid-binding protein [Myxococcus fulvus]SEU33447.1 N-terminal domain of Peptidase_S41 [Myxococcus fulvus]
MRVGVMWLLALWMSAVAGLGCKTAAQAPDSGVLAVPVETLAEMLEAGYVHPETGKRYAAMLRANLAQGAYRAYVDQTELASRLTADLQAVSADGHLRVIPSDGRPRGPREGGPRGPRGPPGLEPIADARWLADGVAYLRINAFPGDERTVDAVDQFMTEHATAKALILDARTHRGGGPREMNVLLSYLFEQEALLAYMDTPRRNLALECGPPEDAMMPEGEGPEGIHRREHRVHPNTTESRLFGARVFYLVSKRTASAAEHLAMALKRTGRATLVGEPTAGANHFACPQPLGDSLSVVLPVGRTVDPDTGKDWEGVGITPDIQVPADKALDEVLQRLR